MADEALYVDGGIPSGSNAAKIKEASTGDQSALAIGVDNIGIGTTSPDELLHLKSANNRLNLKLDAYAHLGQTGGGLATIVSNNAKVSTSVDNQVNYVSSNSDGVSAIQMLYTNGISFFTKDGSNTAGTKFFDSSDRTYERMRITLGGKMGVGVTDPGEKLEVSGAVKLDEATSIGDPGTDKVSIYSAERTGTRAAGTGLFARMPDKGSTSDIRNIAAVDWFNVKDYGATGEGSTYDDANAIQAAIDAANTAGGGVVYIPAGNYRICSTLHMHNYVSLVGAGANATTIIADITAKTGQADFIKDSNSVNIDSQTVGSLAAGDYIKAASHNFEMRSEIQSISGSGPWTVILVDEYEGETIGNTAYATISPVIEVKNLASGVSINNLLITSSQASEQKQVGIDIYRSNYCTIENVEIKEMYIGIYISDYSNTFRFVYCHNCKTGIHLGSNTNGEDYANANSFFGGEICVCTEYGFRIVKGCANAVYGMVIQGNQEANAIGVSLEGTSGHNLICGCHIEGNGGPVASPGYQIKIASKGNRIIGNYISLSISTDPNGKGVPIGWVSCSDPGDGNISFGNSETSNGTNFTYQNKLLSGMIFGNTAYVNSSAVNSGNTSLILNNSSSGGETYALSAGTPNVREAGFSISKLSNYAYGDNIQNISTPILTVNGGSVGIGKTNPSTKLDVDGPIAMKTYTNSTRPSASTLAAGTMIWNSETKKPNFSDGTNWYDAAGTQL